MACPLRGSQECGIAIGAQATGGAGAASPSPIVLFATLAQVAGMGFMAHQIEEIHATQGLRQVPDFSFVEPHQWCFNTKPACHATIEGHLQRFDGIIPAVWITGRVGLAHAGNQPVDSPAIGQGGGKRKKKNIAARDEGVGEAMLGVRNGPLPG